MQRVKNNPRTIKYVEREGSRISLRALSYGKFRVSRDLRKTIYIKKLFLLDF